MYFGCHLYFFFGPVALFCQLLLLVFCAARAANACRSLTEKSESSRLHRDVRCVPRCTVMFRECTNRTPTRLYDRSVDVRHVSVFVEIKADCFAVNSGIDPLH